eukprot:8195152-Karenia_brevis.AAC.1
MMWYGCRKDASGWIYQQRLTMASRSSARASWSGVAFQREESSQRKAPSLCLISWPTKSEIT